MNIGAKTIQNYQEKLSGVSANRHHKKRYHDFSYNSIESAEFKTGPAPGD